MDADKREFGAQEIGDLGELCALNIAIWMQRERINVVVVSWKRQYKDAPSIAGDFGFSKSEPLTNFQ